MGWKASEGLALKILLSTLNINVLFLRLEKQINAKKLKKLVNNRDDQVVIIMVMVVMETMFWESWNDFA